MRVYTFASILMFVLCVWALPTVAQPTTIGLVDKLTADDLKGHLQSAIDPGWQYTPEQVKAGNGIIFDEVQTRSVGYGYTQSAIWIRAKLRNDTSITDWRIHIDENFLQVIDVYAMRANGAADLLIRQTPDSPFSSRPIAFSHLVAPLTLDPDEEITLLIKYWSGGSSSFAFGIETADSFAITAAYTTAKNAFFYGMIMLLIIFAVVGMVVLRNQMFLAYAVYAGALVLYLMHSDGAAFQYLWPGYPLFNGYASIPVGALVCGSAAYVARVFVRTKTYHPVVDKILLAVIFTSISLLAASAFFDHQIIKKLLILLSLISIMLCLISGLVAARTRFMEVRFFVLAWAGAVLSAILMWLRHWLGLDISQEAQYDSMRLVMVFDASMMGMAIVDHYNQLRRSRQRALQASLSEAKRNTTLNRRLAGLEQGYAQMQALDQSRDTALRNTVHDLRQPLHALRLTVSGLMQDPKTPETNDGKVEDTFDYLESLISKELLRSADDPLIASAEATQTPKAEFGVQDVLGKVHSMFKSDTDAAGLRFTFIRSRNEASVDPFVLMRVLSNIVSNAVKYTPSGRITLSSKQHDETLQIIVSDTGVGMDAAGFEAAKARTVRLDATRETTEGMGYGLSIATSLAQQNGWSLGHHARPQGTAICLSIPIGR